MLIIFAGSGILKSFSLALKAVPNRSYGQTLSLPHQLCNSYLLQPLLSNDAIDVFDRSALLELRRAARLQSVLRPASRD
jgi:hypothetical protein